MADEGFPEENGAGGRGGGGLALIGAGRSGGSGTALPGVCRAASRDGAAFLPGGRGRALTYLLSSQGEDSSLRLDILLN